MPLSPPAKLSRPLLPEQGSVNGEELTTLFGKLDLLNIQVNEILSDPFVRRMALEVGIALLVKKYPALGVLLGSFGGVAAGTQKATTGRTAARRRTHVVKPSRGV